MNNIIRINTYLYIEYYSYSTLFTRLGQPVTNNFILEIFPLNIFIKII